MKLTNLLLPLALAATTTVAANVGVNFDEIHELLRKNLAGVTDAELEQAAIHGLINQLHPLVTVVTNTGASTNQTPLAATSVLEGAYAYFRFNQIVDDVDKEFAAALKRIAATNKLKGLVLDLRFTEGDDYAAAAAIADSFLPARQPMIDWGEGLKHSTGKSATTPGADAANATALPVAILINTQTRGAAEAFAAILRRSDIGLLLGDNSAGQAYLTRDFTLKNSDPGSRRATVLRIATTPVKIAHGPSGRAEALDRKGLTPDIKVQVPLGEERGFLQDPYRPLPRFTGSSQSGPNSGSQPNGTNQVAGAGTNSGPRASGRRRLNEAELVRMQREGVDLDSEFLPGRDAGPLRPPVITDPVLARAIDLLKALSVVNRRAF
jgi:Peptidase family S41